MNFQKLNFITQKFFINSKVLKIEEINSGYINKTYIIEHLFNGEKSKFILQRLSNIFESHEMIVMNHKLLTDHISRKLNNDHSLFDSKIWQVPKLIKCKYNNLLFFPFESDFWRAMIYIENTLSFDSLEDQKMAYQTGIGLSKFHLLCSDINSSKLENTIKNFHNTNYYINQYLNAIKDYDIKKLDNNVKIRVQDMISNLSNHIEYVLRLYSTLESNLIKDNVIHGDPKLSNFLFDSRYKYVVSLIDLDTVSLGYLLTDVADCIRSICNLDGEDSRKIEDVRFDINTCICFLNGYLSITNQKNMQTFKFLLEFIYLTIFELTIRFLTDFFQSNKYFKIKYETHNLYRAEIQYRLLYSFLIQLSSLSRDLYEMGFPSSSSFISHVQKFV